MKKLFICLAASFAMLSLNAQNDYEFGNIQKSDLELKDCDFEKGAEAMVLFDIGEVNTNKTQYKRHRRIKILNEKGKSQANVHIRYLSSNADIKYLQAKVYNLNDSGNIITTEVEKDQIFNKKITKRLSELVFTFPNVKEGSIIEYCYTQKMNILSWVFQSNIPVKYSKFIILSDGRFDMESSGIFEVTQLDTIIKNTRTQTYYINNIPSIKVEPFQSNTADYLSVIKPEKYKGFMFWKRIIDNLMIDEDFGLQLNRNIPLTSELDAILKTISDPFEKMITVHNFVRKNMTWNNYYGIWAIDGVRSAWKDKKGSTGEINLILVNLLKEAGLNAFPLLVRTIDEGSIGNTTPSVNSFNKTLAYVLFENNFYVLDATDNYTLPNIIPKDVLCTKGMMIQRSDTAYGGWQDLYKEKKLFNNVIFTRGTIDEKGLMMGTTSIASYDYCKTERLKDLEKGEKYFTEKYFEDNKKVKITDFSLENNTLDTLPLNQNFKFETQLNADEKYTYFSINMFANFNENPFLSETRYSDVFYGANQKYVFITNIQIPKNYTLEELPNNIKLIIPDTSIIFSRLTNFSDGLLSTRIVIEFKKPVYTPGQYPEFYAFNKKMYAVLNEQLVIKKK